MKRRLLILGSTGSIGTQTVDVVEHLNALHRKGEFPFEYIVVGLAAGRNASLAFEQASRLGTTNVALADGQSGIAPPDDVRLFTGPGAAERLVREVDCDVVLAAMVGAAGLPATLAAVELGRDVALANKETLVAAGELVVPAAARTGSKLLPVDSEHAGVWQCLAEFAKSANAGPVPPIGCGKHVSKVILTASGGPFRTWTKEGMDAATPEQALKHPTWSMGPKVTIDSASLMNKALELIEAHWLFGLPASKLGAIIHPQSIVHAIVEYADGSSIAQLGAPDMRTPIQFALTWPARAEGCNRKIDWSTLASLDFQQVDTSKYPAVRLAFDAVSRGGTAGAVLNAANEAAVEAFLARRITFGRISQLVAMAMEEIETRRLGSLEDCMAADAAARRLVASRIS